MKNDTHEQMIAAFQEYFKHHDRFEYHDVIDAGKRARVCLLKIRDLITIRRKEIMDRREALRATRSGKPGRPRKIHNG
jgi:hypothetical protein